MKKERSIGKREIIEGQHFERLILKYNQLHKKMVNKMKKSQDSGVLKYPVILQRYPISCKAKAKAKAKAKTKTKANPKSGHLTRYRNKFSLFRFK
jgi:hypothetical protein